MYPAATRKMKVLNFEGDPYLGANQHIFKAAAPNSSESRVLMVSTGLEGEYNRANRSLQHFSENSIQVLMPIVLLSFVFPIPVFVLTLLFTIARIGYQIGYTNEGWKRGPYFALIMLIHNVLAGMCLLVGFYGMNKNLKPY